MSVLSKIKVFTTQPHACSYLEDEQATTLFIDPEIKIDEIAYLDLTEVGFRRSGEHFYRPHCQSCNDCIPARLPVSLFQPTRRQKRNWNRNSDLEVAIRAARATASTDNTQQPAIDSIDSDEHYALYAKYISLRHQDGDMYPPSFEQFEQFLLKDTRFSRFIEFRLDERLIAVHVCDILPNGYSAIYTFFDPDQSQRGLGNYAVLWLIEQAKRQTKQHIYLGYWIRNCRKMNYKIDYRPIELRLNNRWQTLK